MCHYRKCKTRDCRGLVNATGKGSLLGLCLNCRRLRLNERTARWRANNSDRYTSNGYEPKYRTDLSDFKYQFDYDPDVPRDPFDIAVSYNLIQSSSPEKLIGRVLPRILSGRSFLITPDFSVEVS